MVNARTQAPLPEVPVLCPGGTVVCVASGPSLTAADVEYCRGKATMIVVNDSWRLAPWADALMASDGAWWRHYNGVPDFRGLKFSLEHSAGIYPDVCVLKNTGDSGIEPERTGLRTGRNSGAAAINLAIHFGARRILLLGYDMGAVSEARSHWFGSHPRGLRGDSPYSLFRQKIAEMTQPLRAAGVTVINCSRATALTCFPRQTIEEALQ